MRRVKIEGIIAETMTITGAKAHHLARVLRLKANEQLGVADSAGDAAIAEVIAASGDLIELRLVNREPLNSEPRSRVCLALALLKGDKLEWVIQKAVELGVCEIGLYTGVNSVAKPDGAVMEKKMARYRKIAVEAAEQCGRVIVPRLFYADSLAKLLPDFSQTSEIVALHERERGVSLREIVRDADAITLVIGPEGGLSERELAGCRAAGLGPRILRAETAAIAALAVALAEYGELD